MNSIEIIFLDLDDTVWDGIVGDDTIIKKYNISYDDIVELLKRGIVTCIISNNENKGKALNYLKKNGFDLKIFVDIIFTYTHKNIVIDKILSRLSLKPEKALLIDDADIIRDSVKKIGCKTCRSWDDFLLVKEVWECGYQKESDYMNRLRIRQESFKIIKYTELNAVDYDIVKYLKNNNFSVDVRRANEDQIDRVVDLLYKTNQLHFNKIVFDGNSREDINKKVKKCLDENHDINVVYIEFDSISYGVMGVILSKANRDSIEIYNACFSCTVIPFKYVEYLAISSFVNKCLDQVKQIIICYELNIKNYRIKWLLEDISSKVYNDFVLIDKKINIPKSIRGHINNCRTNNYYDGIYAICKYYDENVIKIIHDKSVMKCADIGYGYGEILGNKRNENIRNAFRDKEGEYYRYDLAPKEKSVLYGDVTRRLNIPNEYMDIVICLELLEHVSCPYKAIIELNRILKIGGYLFLTVPSISFPSHPFDDDVSRFSSKFIRKLLSQFCSEIYVYVQEYNDVEIRTMVLYKKYEMVNKSEIYKIFYEAKSEISLPGPLNYYS